MKKKKVTLYNFFNIVISYILIVEYIKNLKETFLFKIKLILNILLVFAINLYKKYTVKENWNKSYIICMYELVS